jgi:hypothetical protein
MRSSGATPQALRSRATRAGSTAAMNDAKARARPRVKLSDQGRRIFGIGDHHIAARHYRIIAQFKRRAAGIGAMEGRNERDFRDAARHQGDPGGRTRAGVHDVDALGDDEPREAARIEPHRDWVFRAGGKRHQQAADRLQLAGEAPAFGGHQRPRACRHQRGGDVDRRALGAARIDARDDLQDRAPGQRGALAPTIRRQINAAHRRLADRSMNPREARPFLTGSRFWSQQRPRHGKNEALQRGRALDGKRIMGLE